MLNFGKYCKEKQFFSKFGPNVWHFLQYSNQIGEHTCSVETNPPPVLRSLGPSPFRSGT